LKDVQPSVVEVKLDVISEKELAVQADWVGKMTDDLIISQAKVTPRKVVVIGASHFLESLNTIYTEKIPVDTLNQSGSITVNLAVNPAKLKLAPGYKNAVTVDYIVKKREP
jgi:YbbR domain-containing protein